MRLFPILPVNSSLRQKVVQVFQLYELSLNILEHEHRNTITASYCACVKHHACCFVCFLILATVLVLFPHFNRQRSWAIGRVSDLQSLDLNPSSQTPESMLQRWLSDSLPWHLCKIKSEQETESKTPRNFIDQVSRFLWYKWHQLNNLEILEMNLKKFIM